MTCNLQNNLLKNLFCKNQMEGRENQIVQEAHMGERQQGKGKEREIIVLA